MIIVHITVCEGLLPGSGRHLPFASWVATKFPKMRLCESHTPRRVVFAVPLMAGACVQKRNDDWIALWGCFENECGGCTDANMAKGICVENTKNVKFRYQNRVCRILHERLDENLESFIQMSRSWCREGCWMSYAQIFQYILIPMVTHFLGFICGLIAIGAAKMIFVWNPFCWRGPAIRSEFWYKSECKRSAVLYSPHQSKCFSSPRCTVSNWVEEKRVSGCDTHKHPHMVSESLQLWVLEFHIL